MKGVGTNGGDISSISSNMTGTDGCSILWLNSPVYNNGDGCVKPDFKENASSFYGNTTSAESRPFSENVYDGSPVDRV